MADRYKTESRTDSKGDTETIIKKQNDGFMGSYSDHIKITEKANGDVKVEKPSKSFWSRWE